MTITEAFTRYRDDVIAFRNQSRKTEENHFVVMKNLVAYFGDIDMSSLTFPMVRNWKQEMDKSRSPETVRNYIVKLRVVLSYVQLHHDCLDPNQIPIPKRMDKVPAFLTKEQVAQCINATQRIKNKAIVSFLYASGIRISELCSLNRDQLHDNTFTVVGKGGKARLCFIDQRTIELLNQYSMTRTDNLAALFLSDSGKRITAGAVQDTFRTIRKQTGLEVHPHTLRHSFATDLLTNNTNLYYVSKMLGHSSVQTTQQYLHVVDQDLRAIYAQHHTV